MIAKSIVEWQSGRLQCLFLRKKKQRFAFNVTDDVSTDNAKSRKPFSNDSFSHIFSSNTAHIDLAFFINLRIGNHNETMITVSNRSFLSKGGRKRTGS